MDDLSQWLGLIVTALIVGFFLFRDKDKQASDKQYFSGQKPAKQEKSNEHHDWPSIIQQAHQNAKALARPAVALRLIDQPISEDACSSVGGRPSLRPDESWPSDDSGRPMIFLAQINFGDMPLLQGYPPEGLLSFFVQDSDLNGCGFPSVGNKGFKVFYHQSDDDMVRRPLPQSEWEFTPFSARLMREGRRLSGHPATGPISPANLYALSAAKLNSPDVPDDLYEDLCEKLTDAKVSQVYYGGHPDFVQEDFRDASDQKNYSEVLLQLGFLPDKGDGVEICWGDAGEACFLIAKQDLAARRFDRVAYYWDCS